MSTTFNWAVSAMDCLPQEQGNADVVFNVHWTCAGTDGDYSASVYATCGIPYAGGSFTPYEDLTQEEVLTWIWANGVDKDATEEAVEQQIENQINPPVVTPPLPWSASNEV
jgi:hypothetical protein